VEAAVKMAKGPSDYGRVSIESAGERQGVGAVVENRSSGVSRILCSWMDSLEEVDLRSQLAQSASARLPVPILSHTVLRLHERQS
jgi:hypothetical protein